MARITVVIFVLSTSVFCIDAGMHHATQVHNVTHLEKRSPMIEEKEKEPFDCNNVAYKTITLYDFIYTHECFPDGWGDFLKLAEVQKEINTISSYLSEAVKLKIERKLIDNRYRKVPIQGDVIEPPMPDTFNAFKGISLDQVKVVILGQDPTPQAGQATGMAFSLKPGVDPINVPSVHSMLVELKWEGMNVGLTNGDLTPWKGQGVLLLNAALTVKQGKAGSHQLLWKGFTTLLLKYISKNGPRSAWILWGGEAQAFAGLIEKPKHYIKAGGHPSPFSARYFFGGNYFVCANKFLNEKAKRGEVDWSLAPTSVRPMEQCNLPA